jgi:CrcB protein
VTLLLVALGGAAGAVARFLTDRSLAARLGLALPWGTLTVNVSGSLLLGVLAGAAPGLPAQLSTFVGTGFCGALTTYSTFGYETVQLLAARATRYALLSVTANVTFGLAAASIGWWVGAEVLL